MNNGIILTDALDANWIFFTHFIVLGSGSTPRTNRFRKGSHRFYFSRTSRRTAHFHLSFMVMRYTLDNPVASIVNIYLPQILTCLASYIVLQVKCIQNKQELSGVFHYPKFRSRWRLYSNTGKPMTQLPDMSRNCKNTALANGQCRLSTSTISFNIKC